MDTENKLSSDVFGEKNCVRPKAEYGDGIYYYDLTPAQRNIDDIVLGGGKIKRRKWYYGWY